MVILKRQSKDTQFFSVMRVLCYGVPAPARWIRLAETPLGLLLRDGRGVSPASFSSTNRVVEDVFHTTQETP
jgi:hypothetical protein